MKVGRLLHLLTLTFAATSASASSRLDSTTSAEAHSSSSSSALATLSPSSVDSLASPAGSYGLEDVSLAPFVLVGTLDGRIHRLDRETGEVRWTTGPLLDGRAKGKAMVWSDSDEADTERFVVEGRDGDIWVGSEETQGWSWRRLGASVPSLVQASFQSSPVHFRRDHNPSRYFTGTISTSAYSLNLDSGRIIDELDEMYGTDSIRPLSDLLDDLEEGALTNSNILQLTRHDYTLRIHDPAAPPSSRRPRVQTLHFSSFSNPDPSTANPLPFLSRRTFDGLYATLYKGSKEEGSAVLGLRDLPAATEGKMDGPPGLIWGTQVSSVPISFYDVFQVRHPSSSYASAPFLLPQPIYPPSTLPPPTHPDPPSSQRPLPLLSVERTDNATPSSFYALSQRSYPLFNINQPPPDGSLSFQGMHILSDEAWKDRRTGRDRDPLGIEGPKKREAAVVERGGDSHGKDERSTGLATSLWSMLFGGTIALAATVIIYSTLFRSPPQPRVSATTADPSRTPLRATDPSPIPPALEAPSPLPLNVSSDPEPERVPGRKRRRRPRRKKAGGPEEEEEDGEGEDEAGVGADVEVEAKEDGGVSVIVQEQASVEKNGLSGLSRDLIVSDKLIGVGSGGTCVFEGSFQARPVAVKRLLSQFATLHSHEVSLLRSSDNHPNVVRYYLEHATGPWLYIALELCEASLGDLIERPKDLPELHKLFEPLDALRGMSEGLNHLHALGICHRDLTPKNVLISRSSKRRTLVFKLGDFGLAKLVPPDQSSFTQTSATGTVGWRAPECLLDEHGGSRDASGWEIVGGDAGASATGASSRATSAIDVWSAGCLFFYTMTEGRHPFGERFDRERNVCRGRYNLDKLDVLDQGRLLRALISRMLSLDPQDRPSIADVRVHPIFWQSALKLDFLLDASDIFESLCRDPPDEVLIQLEEKSRDVLGEGWMAKFDDRFIESLGKYRKYGTGSVRDLLRAIRNKRHHFLDMEPELREAMAPLPSGFLQFFLSRFPSLFLHVYTVIRTSRLRDEAAFEKHFSFIHDP